MTEYIRRIINFEPADWAIVQYVARQQGGDGKGYSAALGDIIRQWADEHLPGPLPVHAPQPPGCEAEDLTPQDGQDGDVC